MLLPIQITIDMHHKSHLYFRLERNFCNAVAPTVTFENLNIPTSSLSK